MKSATLLRRADGHDARPAVERQVEDTARQILCYGERETPGSTCDKIAAVTKADIAAAAKAALGSAPTVTAYGDVSAMPSYESFAAQFASYKK